MLINIDSVTFQVDILEDIPSVLMNAWGDELLCRCDDDMDMIMTSTEAMTISWFTADVYYDTGIWLRTEDMENYEVLIESGSKAALMLNIHKLDKGYEVTLHPRGTYDYCMEDEITSRYFLELLHIHLNYTNFRGVTWGMGQK